MAVALTGTQYYSYAVGTDFDSMTAFTVAVWAFPVTLAGGNRNIASKWHFNGGAGPRSWVLVYSNTAGKWLWETAYNGGQSTDAVLSSSTPATGAWLHLCGVWTTTRRAIWVNGAEESPNTTSRTSITNNTVNVFAGSQHDVANNWEGRLEHLCAWPGVALSGAEITALARGVHPLRVRRGSIKLYTPLLNTLYSQEMSGSQYVRTTGGTPTNAAGSRVGALSLFAPRGAPLVVPPAGGGWGPLLGLRNNRLVGAL